MSAEKALALNPDLAVAHLARGRLLWTPANHFPHEKAIMEYRRALTLDPTLDEARNQLALVQNFMSARYQEGEVPSEDAAELLREAGEVLQELEDLIRRINRTNAATDLGDGRTRLVATSLVDSFAARDAVLASGMETGLREAYQRLDELLAG